MPGFKRDVGMYLSMPRMIGEVKIPGNLEKSVPQQQSPDSL
jgi:hypothetical protein